MSEHKLLKQLYRYVIDGDNESLKQLIRQGFDLGIGAANMLYEGMLPAMDHIGEQFKQNLIFIPEVLLSARAMNEGLTLLKPHLSKQEKPLDRTVIIGTIHGDMHDIGKNLVSIMLKGAGFTVIDLGFNVPVDRFMEETARVNPDLICLSSLLTTAMPGMKTVIDNLKESGYRSSVKVMVGGAPVSQRFATNIGADGYADDAIRAVDLAKELTHAGL